MAVHQEIGNLHVWWFPKEFSQSRYGEFQQSGTNSCTLITLILADKVIKYEHGFNCDVDELPIRALNVFGDAINEGNSVYNRVFTAIKAQMRNIGSAGNHVVRHKNLNIPDAMKALRNQPSLNFQLKEWFYTHLQADPLNDNYSANMAARMMQVLNVGVELFRQTLVNESENYYLFGIIIGDSRTVLCVFEFPDNIVTFFDSHQHGQRSGAVIAQTRIENLYELTRWFINMQWEIFSSEPPLIEISFITTNPTTLPRPRKTPAKTR